MTDTPDAPLTVRDDRAASRFEAEVEGETAFAEYRIDGDTVVFTHTEVPPRLRERGIGSELIRQALAQVRDAGREVDPRCPFVAAYMREHPEVQDLAAIDL